MFMIHFYILGQRQVEALAREKANDVDLQDLRQFIVSLAASMCSLHDRPMSDGFLIRGIFILL